ARGYRQGTYDSGHRPRDGDDGVGCHPTGGEQAPVRAARCDHHAVCLDHAPTARPPLRRRHADRRGVQAGYGRGRGALLQHERDDRDHGGSGAGCRDPGRLPGWHRGRRVHAASGEAGDHILRTGGQAPGPGDGAGAPEPARDTAPRRRRRRSGHRHYPRLFEQDAGKGGGGEI
ncbi:MAG: RuvC, partial [uncultured Rubrobacteraceae bacterium]